MHTTCIYIYIYIYNYIYIYIYIFIYLYFYLFIYIPVHTLTAVSVRSICIQRFSSSKMLQRHLRMHMKNDENFYGCKVCALSFVCYEALLSHLRGENHKRMKIRIQGVFVCVDCRRVFPSRDSYAMHMLMRAQSEVCGDSIADMRGDDGLLGMHGGDDLADMRGGDGLTDMRESDGVSDMRSSDKDGRTSQDGVNTPVSDESVKGGGDSYQEVTSPARTQIDPAASDDHDNHQHPLNLCTNGSSGESRSESVVAQAQTTAENGYTDKSGDSPDGAPDPVSPDMEKTDDDATITKTPREDIGASPAWHHKDATTLSECLRNDTDSPPELPPPTLKQLRGKKPRGISSSHFRTLAAATLKRNYGPWANHRNRVVRGAPGGNTPMTCVVCWALLDSCDSLAMHMMEQHSQPKSSYFGTPTVQQQPAPQPPPRTPDDTPDESLPPPPPPPPPPPLLLAHVQYQAYPVGTDGGGYGGQDSSGGGEATSAGAPSPECGYALPDSTKRKASITSDDGDAKHRRTSPPGIAIMADALAQCRPEVGAGKASELCPHCGVAFCEHTAWELLTKNGTFRSPGRHASPARIPTLVNAGCDVIDVSRRLSTGGDTATPPDRTTGDDVCVLAARRTPVCENEADGYRKETAADETSNKTLSPQLPEPSHMRVSEDGSSDRSTPGAAVAPTSPRRSMTMTTTTTTLQHDELGEGDVIDYVLSNVDRLAMCKYCRIVFTDRTIYYLHMGLHNLNNPWQCNLCGRACSNVHEFSSHVIHY